MLCQLRTIGAGFAVLAVCFMLASLSWQFLLLGFALASIAWACWSCSIQLDQAFRGGKRSSRQPTAKDACSVETTLPFGARQRRVQSKIYAFPGSDVSSQSSY